MKITVREMVLIAMLSALTFAAKIVLAPIANVELVSILLCVFTVTLGFRNGLLIAIVFTTITAMESTYYGVGDWIIMYYINWPLLSVLSTLLLNDSSTELKAAILLGLFGLLFDASGVAIKLILFGPVYAYSYLISGIPFSIVHGVSNFIIAMFLFKPLCKALKGAKHKFLYR